MMQSINQWCVKVYFTGSITPVEFIVNKSYYREVFLHVAEMTCHAEVCKIEIWQRKNDLSDTSAIGKYFETGQAARGKGDL